MQALSPIQGLRVAVAEPDYKDLIPAMQLRRMTKPIRIGIAAARLCMQSNGNFMPGSIHIGTAYGMLEDSENFLKKILEQDEQMLNPTAFIQSTHNTVSGQIALSIGCTAHNMTFVHKAHSFENALLDASLCLKKMDENENILVGAVEECTDTSYEILKRFGIYDEGANIAGEGATFFGISKNKLHQSIAEIKAFEMFKAADIPMLEATVNRFMENSGVTGNVAINDLLIKTTDNNDPIFTAAESYQQYSGKYATMSAFGLAYACLKLKESGKEYCWLLNGFGNHYSIMLLSKV